MSFSSFHKILILLFLVSSVINFNSCQQANQAVTNSTTTPKKSAVSNSTTSKSNQIKPKPSSEKNLPEVEKVDIKTLTEGKGKAQANQGSSMLNQMRNKANPNPKKAPNNPPINPKQNQSNKGTQTNTETKSNQITSQPTMPQHEIWDALLQGFVSETGSVNYQRLKSNAIKLESYLKSLQSNHPQNTWSKNQKLSYWINAYNAFTVKLILDNYPLKSITDLANGKVWDNKWIKINGEILSLNNIENDIIRPQFNEPRIHFAVNCAAISCPPLHNRAFTSQNLNNILEQLTKKFINNSSYNNISINQIKISKIFEWYAVDFGNLIDFLNRYSSTPINTAAKIEYQDYNWALNN